MPVKMEPDAYQQGPKGQHTQLAYLPSCHVLPLPSGIVRLSQLLDK